MSRSLVEHAVENIAYFSWKSISVTLSEIDLNLLAKYVVLRRKD